MKYLKILGLAAVAAAAVMAFAGTASATILTSPANTQLPAGTEINSHLVEKGKAVLKAEFGEVVCEESVVEGKTSNAGGATETVKGSISSLSFTKCNCEVKVLANGELEIHSIAGTDNGTLTGKGTEVTTSCPSVFGQQHCIWSTTTKAGGATDLGTLVGSKTGTEETAKLKAENAQITHIGGTSFLCGEFGSWTAEYEVTTPKPLFVD